MAALQLTFRWWANYQPACERGAYLSFLLLSTSTSYADQPCFVRPCESSSIASWSTVTLPLEHADVPLNDAVLMVRLYSYNSISPGMFRASNTSELTRTWACQRTAYTMIPLALAPMTNITTTTVPSTLSSASPQSSPFKVMFRMRSMLPMDQPTKGWIEIDWSACVVNNTGNINTTAQRLLQLKPPSYYRYHANHMPDALQIAAEDEGDEYDDAVAASAFASVLHLSSSSRSSSSRSSSSSTGSTSSSNTSTPLSVCLATQHKTWMLRGEEWMRQHSVRLQSMCDPWVRSERRHMDVSAQFACRGLRDKYAPDVYLPIGPVPCMVHLMSLSRCSFDEKLPVRYVGYLAAQVLATMPTHLANVCKAYVLRSPQSSSSSSTTMNRGNRPIIPPTPTVELLELLHSVASLHAQLRPYRLDAIDICAPVLDPRRPENTNHRGHVDWFDVVEAHNPQPFWSPNERRAAMSDPVVCAETNTTARQNRHSRHHNHHHQFAVSDQVDHDMQGAHMADHGNDCESRVSNVLVMFQRIQSCFAGCASHFLRATTLFDELARTDCSINNNNNNNNGDSLTSEARYEWIANNIAAQWRAFVAARDASPPTTAATTTTAAASDPMLGYGLLLSSIANQYVFVYTIVAAAPKYDSRASVDDVHRASLALRTNASVAEHILESPTEQLSPTDHNRCWTDPLGFACHVVGIWFPRARWKVLRERGMQYKDQRLLLRRRNQSSPSPPPPPLPTPQRTTIFESADTSAYPTGVCDPSDQSNAMQFVSTVADAWARSSPNPPPTAADARAAAAAVASYERAYDALHDTERGYAHVRLMSVRKPASYTKEYMQYSMAVTACEYDSLRLHPAVGDVVFVDTATHKYGLPFAQLMRPGVASDANFDMDRLDRPSSFFASASSSSSSSPTSSPVTRSSFAAEPLTEPLSCEQRRNIHECLHLIPRPAALPIDERVRDGLGVSPNGTESASSSPSSDNTPAVDTQPILCAWMTRTNWLQKPPQCNSAVERKTYGDLFQDWAVSMRATWDIRVSREFVWLYNGCEAKVVTFFKSQKK